VSGKTEITISTRSREISIRDAGKFLTHGGDCMKLITLSGFDGDSPIVSLLHFCGMWQCPSVDASVMAFD
jgi:hypothetical protein